MIFLIPSTRTFNIKMGLSIKTFGVKSCTECPLREVINMNLNITDLNDGRTAQH